jgi:hypothetical protein
MQAPESSLEALSTRVAKLEAQNRYLKKTGIALSILAGAVIAMGQAPTKRVITANEFVLLDESGTTRARLSMETKDKPALTFLRDRTTPTASIQGGDEPVLVLTRPGSDEQITLMANKTFYGLTLYDKTSPRASLVVSKGLPALDLADQSGIPQTTLEARPTGSMLFLKNPAGKESSMLWVDSSNGGASFDMRGSTGTVHVNLGQDPVGPSLQLEDGEGFSTTLGRSDLLEPRTGRKERTPAASVVLFGKDQKVLWSAP